MQTVELAAGRKLDGEVARSIMGWTLTRNEYGVRFGIPPGAGPMDVSIPPYSTDLAAAWQLVEHVRKQYRIRIESNASPSEWDCIIFTAEQPINTVADGEGDTAPLAICRAALAAIAH